jgi:hypothetical protein
MKWLYLWFAYMISKPFGRVFGEEIGASILGGILFLFGMIILWRSKIGQKVRFQISVLILLLPYLGKLAFNHGFRNFPPGSEPSGFRGIKWETEFSSVFPEFNKTKEFKTDSRYDGLLKSYFMEDDDLTIGMAVLETIEYAFWDGKFQGVRIQAKDPVDWDGLKETTFEKFGRGFQPDKHVETYEWRGKETKAILERNKESKLGTLAIASIESLKEVARYMKQKAKEGAKRGF